MDTTQKASQAKADFIAYLQSQGKRITQERLSIIEVIARHSGLFTIEELQAMMLRESFPVSTATLYNTVELLTEARLLKCVRIPGRSTAHYRFDRDDAVRVYLVCEQCGSVKEGSAKTVSTYLRQSTFAGIEPRSYTLTVSGICRKCRKKK